MPSVVVFSYCYGVCRGWNFDPSTKSVCSIQLSFCNYLEVPLLQLKWYLNGVKMQGGNA